MIFGRDRLQNFATTSVGWRCSNGWPPPDRWNLSAAYKNKHGAIAARAGSVEHVKKAELAASPLTTALEIEIDRGPLMLTPGSRLFKLGRELQ